MKKISIEQPSLDPQETFQEILKFRNRYFVDERVTPKDQDNKLKEKEKIEVVQPAIIKENEIGKSKEKKAQVFLFSVKADDHEISEDYAFVDEKKMTIILSDGMGGLEAGSYASKKVVNEAKKVVGRIDYQQSEKEILLQAKTQITEIKKNVDKGGATLSLAKIFINEKGAIKALIVSVGDSKVFRRKLQGEIESLTIEANSWNAFIKNVNDKNLRLYEELMKKNFVGELTFGQMEKIFEEMRKQKDLKKYLKQKADSYYNITFDEVKKNRDIFFLFYRKLNRCSEGILASQRDFSVQAKIIDINKEDLLFATCDGVHDNLSEREIAETLVTGQAQELELLVKKAYESSHGKKAVAKKDDITVVGIKII